MNKDYSEKQYELKLFLFLYQSTEEFCCTFQSNPSLYSVILYVKGRCKIKMNNIIKLLSLLAPSFIPFI